MTDSKNSFSGELFIRLLMTLTLAVVWVLLPFIPIVRGVIAFKRWSARHEMLWNDLKYFMFVTATVTFLGVVS